MPLVTINHPNMPYMINVAYSKMGLCSIRMDNNIYRVVHCRTGLAIQEFRNSKDAKEFIKRLVRDDTAMKYLRIVDRAYMRDPANIKRKERFEFIIECNLHNLDVASDNQAFNCRYYNKPIYLGGLS